MLSLFLQLIEVFLMKISFFCKIVTFNTAVTLALMFPMLQNDLQIKEQKI